MRKSFRVVKYRRQREGKTNYRRRLKQLISKKLRLVVRKFSRSIIAQIITYDPKGDKVLASVNSLDLRKFGLKINTGNTPSAYLAGYLLGKKIRGRDIGEVIADIGNHKSTKGAKVYAVIKGFQDAGGDINFSGEMAPLEYRIKGNHIDTYLKNKPVDNIQKHFEDIKAKIDLEFSK